MNEKIALTHNVHASELRPNLSKKANKGAVDHIGLEQIQVGNIGMLTLKLAHVLDVLQLVGNKGVVRISLAVNESKHGTAVLPAVLTGEPTRGLGKKHHHEEEEEGGDHLEAPWDTPGGSVVLDRVLLANEGAAVGDVVHDEDTPGNGPLLHTDEATTLGGGRDFGNVDGDLSRLDTDGETVDDTGDNEHTNVLGGTRESRTNDPGTCIISIQETRAAS